MIDRLEYLHLLPPTPDRIWSGHTLRDAACAIKRLDDASVTLPLPLFWYEPLWIRLSPTIADQLAVAVSRLGVTVSALARDLGAPEHETGLLSNQTSDEESPPSFLPRVVPYRVERYGLSPEDFDGASVIDVRVSAVRDRSGRLAYAPEQMQRWEQAPEESPIAGGGYVAAGTFPPDVVSLSQLAIKLSQLRTLAPSAAVFLSIGPFNLEEEIPAVLPSQPDGLILRLDEAEVQGKYLAGALCGAKKLLRDNGAADLPIWVVPGAVTADDIAKMIALGASGVAIDSWCEPLVDAVIEATPVSRYRAAPSINADALAEDYLGKDIERVTGLVSTIEPSLSPKQLLGSFHPTWAKLCRVKQLR